MNRLVFVGMAFLGCALWSVSASAQCVRFSTDIACEAKGQLKNLTFGVGKTESQPSARLVTSTPKPETLLRTQPIDCAMVKRVDPQFHAATPVIKPDPTTKFSLRIITAPPCKGS